MAAVSKSILSLLLLTGAAIASPLTPRASTVFTLTDIFYEQNQTYSAPPHISAYSNTVSFTLTNTAISRVTKCHVTGTGEPADIFFNGDEAFICDGGVSSFRFDGTTFTVADDTNVSGSGTADFTCNSVETINPDWTLTNGEIYKVDDTKCTEAELDITAS